MNDIKEKYKLSVFLPTIRTHQLEKWYETLEKACKKYSFQVIFASPFDLPESLAKRDNVKLIKSFAHPTKCAHIAALECEGELIHHNVDDTWFYEDSIDKNIEFWDKSCYPRDIISMRYIEGQNHATTETFPMDYWKAGTYYPVPHIKPDWNINCHFMMKKELFLEYGGFDCKYEYLTYACQDMLFRMQRDGCRVYDSLCDVSNADWYPGAMKDHGPIVVAQCHVDEPKFKFEWVYTPGGNPLSKIDIKNHELYPEYWARRFAGKKPSTYIELNLNP